MCYFILKVLAEFVCVVISNLLLTVQHVKFIHFPVSMSCFAKLAGGKFFTELDMSNAYLQLPLDPASKHYMTRNTQKGLF